MALVDRILYRIPLCRQNTALGRALSVELPPPNFVFQGLMVNIDLDP